MVAYIKIDSKNAVTSVFIGLPLNPSEFIKIETNETDMGYWFDREHIPLRKWDRKKVVPRTAEEIAADRAVLPKRGPSMAEQTRMNTEAINKITRVVAQFLGGGKHV